MIKDRLQTAVARASREEKRFCAALGGAELREAGTHDHWSAKDLIAHVAAAKLRLVGAHDAAARGEAASLDHDEPSVYAEHAEDTWDEVNVLNEQADARLRALVHGVDEQELTSPDRHLWLMGKPLATVVAGYAVRHPLSHLADFLHHRGRPEDAARVAAEAEAILDLLPPDVAHPAE